MSDPTHLPCPANASAFRKLVEDSGCREIRLHLQTASPSARRITRKDYRFYDETIQYFVTMISASLGKWASIGGTLQEGALDVRCIGRALDADIYFPGIPLLWSNSLGYPVTELEVDIRPVPKGEKESTAHHVAMRDVGAKADAVFFLQAFEKAKDRIEEKYGNGWFKNWPEVLRFAYLVRNGLAHDGCWAIQEQKGREHYQTEAFRWPTGNLTVRMRHDDGTKIDEGRPVLDYLNGMDFVVLMFELSDALQ